MAFRINESALSGASSTTRQHRDFIIQQAAPEAIHEESLDGRNFLVVPAIGLVEGVLQAATAPAPEFIAFEDIERSVPLWNGRPVTLGHPQRDGSFVSASSSPGVFFDEITGFVFNSRAEDGKLKFDLFFDLERLPASERSRLESGDTVEVSTGFFADLIEDKGDFNGRTFSARLANIGPDHFAILGENDMGACSVEDGCGIPRLNQLRVNDAGRMQVNIACNCGGGCETCGAKESLSSDSRAPENDHLSSHAFFSASEAEERLNIRSTARRPTFSDTDESSFSAPTFADLKSAFAPDADFDSVRAAPASFKRQAAAISLLGDPRADNLRELIFFPVVKPDTGDLNRRALNAVLGGRGAQANIPESARSSARRMARRLLESEFGVERESRSNATRKTFDNFFEGFVGDSATDLGESRPVLDEEIPAMSSSAFFVVIREDTKAILKRWFDSQGEAESSAMSFTDRNGVTTIVARVVGALGDNLVFQGITGFEPDVDSRNNAASNQTLDNGRNNNHSQKELQSLNKAFNSIEGFVRKLSTFFTGDSKMNEKINALIEDGLFTNDDKDYLESLDEQRLDAFLAATKQSGGAGAGSEAQKVDGEAQQPESVAAEANTEDSASAEAESTDTVTITVEQKAVLDRALAAERAEKADLVKTLTADKACPFSNEQLTSKDIDELRALAKWVKKEGADADATASRAANVSYAGRGGPSANEVKEMPWRKSRILVSKRERDAAQSAA